MSRISMWKQKLFRGLVVGRSRAFFEGTTRSCQPSAETQNTDCLNTKASNSICDRRYHDGTKLKYEFFLRNKKHFLILVHGYMDKVVALGKLDCALKKIIKYN